MKRSPPPAPMDGNPLEDASWLYSYADLMTQLLIFAIMMVTVAGLKQSNAARPKPAPEDPLASTVRALEAFVAQSDLASQVAVERGADRVVIRVTSQLLFNEAQAALSPRAEQVLEGVVKLLGPIPNEVRVEGHTDDVPMRSVAFTSNWELSSARAISVARYLEEHGVARARLSVAGCAEHRPMLPNDTPTHRAANRRVELVVLSE